MSEPTWGHFPPTGDDGEPLTEPARFGWWQLNPNGTVKNLVSGTTHDLSNIGGGSSGVDLPSVVVDHPERPPIAQLGDTDSIEIPVLVPDSETLEVYRWGAFDVSDGSSPSGLTVELLDGADTVQASESTANTQNKDSPVASHQNTSGSPSPFKLRALNSTGAAIDTPGVGCVFGFRVV